MAGVRVIALAMTCACRASAAQPAASPAIPSEWRALPEVAAALAIDGARAWGDPARGCYAIDFALADLDRDDAIAGLRAAGFTYERAAAGGAASATPASDETGAFARGAYRGRARIAGGGVTAYLWNEREPDACARACAGVVP